MSRGRRLSPPLRYRVVVRLLAPLLLIHLLIRARRDGGWRYVRERLGIGSRPSAAEPALPNTGADTGTDASPEKLRPWIHAASVGEVMTLLPLLRLLLQRSDIDSVLVTVNTPTGAAVLQQQALEGVRSRYLPIDWPGATRRFLARERPTSGWLVETEIWPWLYAQAARIELPLTIINARLSRRTMRHADGFPGPVYREALSRVTILARSTDDAAAYQALGADAQRVQVIGELKFASPGTDTPTPARLIDGDYVLAASTHEDEEQQLADAWLEQRDDGLLVIAPRHPERGESLARSLTDAQRRSLGEAPAPGARLYLADTLGELDAWYAHAAGVFVGGSLIARGGHNVLEPARHGRPIVVGEHTNNFADVVESFSNEDGLTVAADATDVAAFMSRSLDGDQTLLEQGERARACGLEGADVAERYESALLQASQGVDASSHVTR